MENLTEIRRIGRELVKNYVASGRQEKLRKFAKDNGIVFKTSGMEKYEYIKKSSLPRLRWRERENLFYLYYVDMHGDSTVSVIVDEPNPVISNDLALLLYYFVLNDETLQKAKVRARLRKRNLDKGKRERGELYVNLEVRSLEDRLGSGKYALGWAASLSQRHKSSVSAKETSLEIAEHNKKVAVKDNVLGWFLESEEAICRIKKIPFDKEEAKNTFNKLRENI